MFFFSNGMDAEYAVIGRVARRIWAIAMRDRYGASERSQKLKYHVQTSGRSLHAQEMNFNDIRTTLQALCAVYDNCNSLHTNAYDEAVTTPSAESVRRALAIQFIIEKECGLAGNENPLQGSYVVDELTDLVEEAVLIEFDRIAERGGVLGAMETGYQRGRIQDESMLYEHRKHDGSLSIIGVNTFLAPDGDADQAPRELELARATESEKQSQLERPSAFHERLRTDSPAALAKLQAAATEGGNTFAALMEAVRSCSLGQITQAFFEVGGQYRRTSDGGDCGACGRARRVAVIGACAAGICAAKHLLQRGLDVTVFEMGSCIGELWVYENDNGRSPAYKSLHINSEAAVTSYEDFAFPPGTPLFPPHALVRSYLEDYARAFGVDERIRFNTPVTAVEPLEDERWRVVLADGSSEVFDAVVAAPGHQAEPSHPPFRDQFTGEYLHVHDYRVPEPFAGKRVLVVGTGNSAMDSAADVAGVAASVAVVARSPVLIMPRMLFGVPTARVLAKVERPWMPWPLRRRLRVLLATIVHGRMERWGLTTPTKRTHPTGHPTLMSHATYGRIVFRPGIRQVRGREVEFVDGRTEEYDSCWRRRATRWICRSCRPRWCPSSAVASTCTSASSRRAGRTSTLSASSTSAAARTSG